MCESDYAIESSPLKLQAERGENFQRIGRGIYLQGTCGTTYYVVLKRKQALNQCKSSKVNVTFKIR